MKRSVLLSALLLLPLSGTALADARADVVAAFGKVVADKSYHATITTEGKRGTTLRMAVQFPDRYHMVSPDAEFIIVPEGTWMNMGGQWMKAPMNMSQMIAGYSKEAMEKGAESIGQVEFLGEETVEGCASKNYRYVQSGEFMGVRSNSEAVISICQTHGKPVRVVTGETGKKERVTVVYDWDAPVNIRAPR